MDDSEFYGYWSERDKEIWKNTNWDALQSNSVFVEEDNFDGEIYFYSTQECFTKPATFHKKISRDTNIPPHYIPVMSPTISFYMTGNGYAPPIFDGRTHQQYRIYDRYETYDLKNRLNG